MSASNRRFASMFDLHRSARLVIEKDGLVLFIPDFIAHKEAIEIHAELLRALDWTTESIRIYGKSIQSPRLVSWVGDPDAEYRYSGIVHKPLAWHPILLEIKKRLEIGTERQFNAVLCNLYRDGNDSMGWHADNEKELGEDPLIGSVSLGQPRTFRIRHIKSGSTHDIEMNSGCLIVMAGPLQRHWRHCVPKSGNAAGSRINLSFRKITSLLNEAPDP